MICGEAYQGLFVNGTPEGLSSGFSEVVEKVSKSVVSISVVRIAFDQFLTPISVKGVGSGFIIGEGMVVTNAHVVSNANTVMVVYSDGLSEEAEVVARDPQRDLALISIGRRGVEAVKLGDSDKLRLGKIVFAIGSPLGLPGPTVTMGVVSALGRVIAHEDILLEDLIQTDAAINPGNSGGPLVNTAGEAIGVVTAIIPYAQGIGFAIPINSVKRFVKLLSRFGRPVRVYLGLYVMPIDPRLAGTYGLPVKRGLLVVKVFPGTPAYDAGLRRGDVIIRINGKEVTRASELRSEVEDSVDRGFVELEVLRGGQRYEVRVPILVEVLD